jgi:MbtH protein
MANPFENDAGVYHVLINDEGQHSLWPTFITVPAGWKIAKLSSSRSECIEYIEQNWTDMRPNTLKRFMDSSSDREKQK